MSAAMRNAAIAIAVIAALLVAGLAALRGLAPAAAKAIPTAHVQQGRVQVTVYTVGELRGTRTVQIAVPTMGEPVAARQATPNRPTP